MTYDEADKLLTSRESKKVAGNTYLHRNVDGSIGLRFHFTDVLTFYRDFTIYDSGGWHTATTKHRMNTFGPARFRVWQDKYRWHLHAYGNSPTDPIRLFEFVDGMRVTQDGRVLVPGAFQS